MAKPKKAKQPTLFELTGERYPHDGRFRKGRDPRMADYLANLATVLEDGVEDRILWVLCAGIWWLKPTQSREVAAILAKMFEHEP